MTMTHTPAATAADTNLQPEIIGKKLTLRPLRPSDAGLIEMHASDARVAKMTSNIPHPYPPGAVEAFLSRAMAQNASEVIYAMDASAQGGSEVMGLISLNKLDDSQSEIGYWVAPAPRRGC